MLIPWETQEQNMSFAAIHAALPLQCASAYYEMEGKESELAWCRKVKASLSDKYGLEVKYPVRSRVKKPTTFQIEWKVDNNSRS